MYGTLLEPGEAVEYNLASDRRAWVHVARGSVTVNGVALVEGDGVRIEHESVIRIEGRDSAEMLLFDLL